MEEPLSELANRRGALRVLGLTDPATDGDIKRAYRALVREHHPDHGGDAAAFTALRHAYDVLIATEPDMRLRVARGRPSRHATPADALDPEIFWDGPPATPGSRLSVDAIARTVYLLDNGHFVAVSRKPSSRLNGLARHLATDLATRLQVHRGADDRRHPALLVEIRAMHRAARRALDQVDLQGCWQRQRTASSTAVHTTVLCSDDRKRDAAHVAARIEALLLGMDWPCQQWTVVTAPH